MLLHSLLALLIAPPALPFAGPPDGPFARTADTDTTVSVAPGTRLRVEVMGGDIVVRAWDRNQVRIQAAHSRSTRVEIKQSGSELSLESTGRFGLGGAVDYELTVPAWMALKLGGLSSTVSVEGTRAPIEVETMDGDVTVKGGGEIVKLSSMSGRIAASGVRGRLAVQSPSEDVEISDLQGDLVAEVISGDLFLRGIRAKSLEVSGVSGDIWFDGQILEGGQYSLNTHSGDIVMAIPEGVNATLSARVYSGDVQASFPLPASESTSRGHRRLRFGNGSAVVELEAFSGDIELLRPAAFATRLDQMLQRRKDREDAKERAKRDRKPGPDQEADHAIPR